MIASILPLLLGAIVILGWAFDLDLLKRIHPDWVTMKFNTALCFILTGGILVSRTLDERWGDFGMARVTCALTLLVFIFSVMWATLAGGGQFVHELFVKDTSTTLTVSPGQPSTATMVAFLLTSIAGLPYRSRVCRICGAGVLIIGASAVMGYLIGSPPMYFATDKSTAMAAHTALGFMAAGGALLQGEPV